jgi:hypothetical protein
MASKRCIETTGIGVMDTYKISHPGKVWCDPRTWCGLLSHTKLDGSSLGISGNTGGKSGRVKGIYCLLRSALPYKVKT